MENLNELNVQELNVQELKHAEMKEVEGGFLGMILMIWGAGILGIGEHNGWWDIF